MTSWGFDIGGGAAIVVTMPSIGKRSEPPVAAIHELPTVDIARGINIRAASPRRRSIRLPTHDYSSPGAYYITLVTAQRTMLFGGVMEGIMQRSETGDVVSGLWQRLVDHYPEIELGDFTVMPNHVHGIIVINRREAIREMPLREDGVIRRRTRRQILLPKVIGRFKMTSAKSINEMRGSSGKPVWQRNYYEHVIRNEESLNQIRQYIQDNPRKREFDQKNPHTTKPEPPDNWLGAKA